MYLSASQLLTVVLGTNAWEDVLDQIFASKAEILEVEQTSNR